MLQLSVSQDHLAHPRTGRNLSNKSTLNRVGLSLYSSGNGSTFNSTFHTPNSTVPCFTCHGPMHNITKPDESTRFIKNTDTESSQCTTCHQSYNKHNTNVNCTLCHSDDVHAINVFAQNATYVKLNKSNPNTYRGNCTNCHQNATFFNTLKSDPIAGSYSGNDPKQIPSPLNHSTNPYSGFLWNPSLYWINTSQFSACQYCHGSTQHNTSALGNIASVQGSNSLNQSLTDSTWCANCHYAAASGYGGTNFNPNHQR